MSTTEAFTPPSDFSQYEKWVNDGRVIPSADTKAEQAIASKTATESETDQTAETETGDEGKDEAAEKPQKKSGFQRRIDRLNQKLGAREARIAELEKLQGGNAATQTEAAKTEPAKPAGKPEAKDFETYEAYIEALTDWKADDREKRREEAQAKRDSEAAAAAAIKAADDAFSERKALYPDWDEKLQAAAKVQITELMHNVIIQSEFRADIGYFFAEHPAEAARIAKLPALRQAAELGKLEATFSDKTADKTATADTPKPRVTKAPPPAKTVRPAAESSEPDPSDFSAWEKWRNKQPGASLRR